MNTRHLDYHPDGQIKSIKDIKDNKEMLIATYDYNHIRQRIRKTTYNHQGNPQDKTEVYSIHSDHLGIPKVITNQN